MVSIAHRFLYVVTCTCALLSNFTPSPRLSTSLSSYCPRPLTAQVARHIWNSRQEGRVTYLSLVLYFQGRFFSFVVRRANLKTPEAMSHSLPPRVP
ncbi:hypothetical protein LX36DRAFT_348426 [Colletotrichum falcatum]|nr:hypothetical protein LX36DRAFT_348426 [Colletotrichum falcatum]